MPDAKRLSMTRADALASTIPMKPPVLRAPGIECQRTPGGLILTRRWLRTKHYVLGALVVLGWAWLGSQWSQADGAPGWLVLATLFGVSLAYNVATMFINQTKIHMTDRHVEVTHGPFPSPFAVRRELDKEGVARLSVEARGALFAIVAIAGDGQKSTVVAPLASVHQARFVEYQLSHAWGLVSVVSDREDEKLDKSGAAAGLLGLLIPVAIVGAFVFVSDLTSANVSGSLSGGKGAGALHFVPDGCTSGQRDGFSGVTLTQTGSPDVVRVVSDPIEGKLLVVARPGRKGQIIRGQGCRTFELEAARTDTNVNEIWLVDGRMKVDCPELSGSVSFGGCQ